MTLERGDSDTLDLTWEGGCRHDMGRRLFMSVWLWWCC